MSNEKDIQFTHLHVHTEYSLLDGSSKIKELIKQVKDFGMDSLAITDHGVMYGVIDFYREAKRQGIKPIIGCEVYVAGGSRFDKENTKEHRYYHMVLLAENQVGYENLMKLVSYGFTEGFYYKPRVDMELLEKYSEGIIALSACLAGEVSRQLNYDDYEAAKKAAIKYNTIFGQDNFYLEMQDHGYEEQQKVNEGMRRLSRELGIPLVATNDIHYTYAEDVAAHDILLCIQTNKKVSDQDRMRYKGGQFFAKSPEQMAEIFPEDLEALRNTHKIADRCNVEFEFGKLKLPKFDVPKGYEASSYLRELCYNGLKERYKDITSELEERLEYELSVIEKMGYVDYFLIVWDFIKYAKDNNIKVGPGRGSAAGSIVSYTLRITDIDPIKYQLLFERFLNPERVSMPDIDIDFCYERRQEVIDYVVEKYGKDQVAQIITFGTMAARAAIRDVGRALDMPYGEVDKVAKMIPQELKITIDRALKINKDLKKLYEEDENIKHLIDMSRRLEGLPRHSSTHAAGVVICEQPVHDYVPLNTNEGAITTQFTMTTLEELGLLKMDFLGLRTLTVIQNAVEQIKYNQGIHIDIDDIPLDDQKTYELISSGKTDGIFQLESDGMKSFMKELKPRNLEDIIAGISLYRPGPMDFIPKYIKGKRDAGSINYICKQLEPILDTTYGCIVYQEQVMQIVRDLAGYTLGRSDLVRRAMSKKKVDVMNREKVNFIYGNEEEGVPGCKSIGITEQDAKAIFDEMNDFAKYAFNKSHAAAYAIVAYQTAWLKAYYPVEFMAALLSSVMDSASKVSEYIGTLRQMEIELLPPDVNGGFSSFSVSDKKIRFSLAALKNVGKGVIRQLVKERQKNGAFVSFTDFTQRMIDYGINKRMIESMIKGGAFDSLGGNRKQYMEGYKPILDSIVHEKKNIMAGQLDLFGFGDDKGVVSNKKDMLPSVEEYEIEQLLASEKEVLGVYVSGHPLEAYEEMWRRKISNKSIDFVLEEEEGNTYKVEEGSFVIVGGVITEKTVKTIRNNQTMAFIMIEDLYGLVEIILFPNVYEKYKMHIEEDNKIFVKGRVSIQEDQNAKLICQQIRTFDALQVQKIFLRFDNIEAYKEKQSAIEQVLESHEGTAVVVLYIEDKKLKKTLPEHFNIPATEAVLTKIGQIIGKTNVKVVESMLNF